MDFENCEENVPDNDTDDDFNTVTKRLLRKQTIQSKQLCAKDERNATIKKISLILQKTENERSSQDMELLGEYKDIVKEVKSRWKKRDQAKRRLEEFEEPFEQLKEKCTILAQAIAQSQHLVVYTGAGISTAARIPDYRGTNGIWTRLQQGKEIGNHDLSLAEPTYTHMALSELYKRNILKYVVSQNCDGLHLRSGLPKVAISEVHGNMYIEVCKTCKPAREYWRMFDVTENTARYSHKTMRKCYICNGPLVDTIVHFGERGSLQWPLNWSGASKNAKKATTIVCLGSSLKVLKKYPWLWQMHKPVKRRPNLYIVNLQWTPKDDCANVKIHGKCDVVMKIVMNLLGINVPEYDRIMDPIFVHGTKLCEQELHTTTQPLLKCTSSEMKDEVKDVEMKMEDEVKPKEEDIKSEVEEMKSEEEDEEDDEDMQPINYCRKDLESSLEDDLKQSDHENCDTIISNIYSINRNVNIPAETNLPNSYNTQDDIQIPYAHQNFLKIDHLLRESSNQFAEKALNLVKKENILHENLLLNQNCQALLAYYQISNSIFQNQMLSYKDMLSYPFQTSFLYSGLHNIINPIPIINEEHNYALYNHKIEEEKEPACNYCFENYKSHTCLFYDNYEAKFLKQQFRFSKIDKIDKPLYCACCDYTTEEEDDDKINEDVSPDKISKIASEQENEPKVKIQPGWFGKGYRKNRKYKKKVAT